MLRNQRDWSKMRFAVGDKVQLYPKLTDDQIFTVFGDSEEAVAHRNETATIMGISEYADFSYNIEYDDGTELTIVCDFDLL